jgi:hypothetical protein
MNKMYFYGGGGGIKSYKFLTFTRFQVLPLVITKTTVFWGLTVQSSRMVLTMFRRNPPPPSSRYKGKCPKVGDRWFLQTAGNILSDYTASPHPRR